MKKTLFISTIALCVISLSACSTNKNNTTNSNSSGSINTTTSKRYKIGETATIDKTEFTLKSAKVINNGDQSQMSNTIRVIYTVKNHSNNTLESDNLLIILGPDNSEVTSTTSNSQKILPGNEKTIITSFSVNKLGSFTFTFSPSTSSSKSVKFKVKIKSDTSSQNSTNNSQTDQNSDKETSTSLENSSLSSSETQSSATHSGNASTNGNKIIVAGHSFHHSNFHGTDILVGDNHEGELGEWAANEPSIQSNPQLKAQVEAQLKSIYHN